MKDWKIKIINKPDEEKANEMIQKLEIILTKLLGGEMNNEKSN